MENRKPLILIIDDDDLVLKTFNLLLKREGYATHTAASYEAAMEAISRVKMDLILSDIRMPGRNGVETVREILAKVKETGRQDLPIIFITGYAEMSVELQADFLGEVLYKPIDMNHLLVTIREYL